MTNGQATVIVLLLVLFALEAVKIPAVRSFVSSSFSAFGKGVNS